MMHLCVGLGNPGPTYAYHRHNVGAMVLEFLAKEWSFPPFRKRFQGLISEKKFNAHHLIFLFPQTFMNESGRSVGEALHFYKLTAQDVTILHDELDLPLCKIRLKRGGGSGGHNGLRSISAHIGPDYRRFRIGIGHPGHKDLVHHYVLGDFSKKEQNAIDLLQTLLAQQGSFLFEEDDATLQNRIHQASQAHGLFERAEACKVPDPSMRDP